MMTGSPTFSTATTEGLRANDDTLWVWHNADVIGTLSMTDRGEYLFEYSSDAPPEKRASLIMPNDGSINDYQQMPPAFCQHLPEGSLREILLKGIYKCLPRSLNDIRDDEFALLSVTGKSQLGRIRVTRPDEHPLSIGETTIENMDDILANGGRREWLDEFLSDHGITSGISGVQPKVLADARNQRFIGTTGRYLIKMQGENYPWIAVNEYLCALCARAAGLRTAKDIRLSDDGKTLAIQRFDYNEITYEPYGLEDACALASLRPGHKYHGDYEDVFAITMPHIDSLHVGADRADLFKRMVLSLVLGDGDAHLKNFALVSNEHGTRLSPVYDVVTTTLYIPRDLPALSVMGVKAWPDRPALVKLGRKAGLATREAGRLIDEVTSGVRESIEQIDRLKSALPVPQEVFDRLKNAWRLGLSRCSDGVRHRIGRPN